MSAQYAGLIYSDFATSSGRSKITVGRGSSDDVKTILEALDDALFDPVCGAINNRPLREYFETESLGTISEMALKMYGEYCGGSAQWQLMSADEHSEVRISTVRLRPSD